MLLRLNLAMTNFRQLDVTVRDDINAAELSALVYRIANVLATLHLRCSRWWTSVAERIAGIDTSTRGQEDDSE